MSKPGFPKLRRIRERGRYNFFHSRIKQCLFMKFFVLCGPKVFCFFNKHSAVSFTMACVGGNGVGSSMFFEMLLVVTVTFISAANGEESVTVIPVNKDEVKEYFNTSEHTNYSKENHGYLQRKNLIVFLVAKMRVVDKLEETSTLKEDTSEDLDSTTILDIETTEDSSIIDTRVLFDAPMRSCEKNFQRDRRGKCRRVFV